MTCRSTRPTSLTVPAPSAAAERPRRGARARPPASALALALGLALGGLAIGPVAAASGDVAQKAAPAAGSAKAGKATPALRGRDGELVDRVLPNGLRVLIKVDRRAPTAIQRIFYRAGSIDEVNGRTGVAHALEHMMFKGTPTHPGGAYSKIVARMGGTENASTSTLFTDYHQQVPVSGLPEILRLEADRMAHLTITAEEFAREIRVVREERRLRTDDRAPGLLYEQLMATAFVASPVRTPTVGWMDDLQAMTVDDVRDWYRAWYAPNNAVRVVVGDVDVDRVMQQIVASYGAIPKRPLPVRKPQVEPVQKGLRRVIVKAPAENPSVLLAFKVPRLEAVDKDVDPYALELLAAVLDADATGRITREVVRRERVANRAGAGYEMMSRGPVLFMLSGTPAQGRTTAEVEAALRAQIERIAKEGVTDEELRRVKNQYVAGRVYQRDSPMSSAVELGYAAIVGMAPTVHDTLLERIRQIDSAQIQAVAARYFGDDELTVATLDPQPIDPAQARPPGGPSVSQKPTAQEAQR